MNRGLFKLIFNRRSGLFTPTWEGAAACGKASSTARACVLTLTLLFFSHAVLANPSGATVINGNVSFDNNGNTYTITNSPSAIINWKSFSINKDEITRFIQQNGTSAVLNRIVGHDPSKILGSLQSNGRVFIINPNGIVFGQGATIDVAGLVASTLKMSDTDFLSGKYNFTDGTGAGAIKNQGTITSATGGQVYLIAPDIENNGIITSPKGEIVLAAGHSVSLVDPRNPEIVVSLTASATQAVNVGQLISEGGSIGVYAGLVRQGGTINANSASVDESGRVYLRGTQTTTLTEKSVTTANNSVGSGGEITISSGEATNIAAGASIEANAGQNGNGGKVTVWSDGNTQFDGKISAQGGAQSGNGGFVETSGRQQIKIGDTARVTTLAAKGNSGTWLIDPSDFTIAASGGDISGATLSTNLMGGNVTILSSNGANTMGSGDINVNDAVNWSANKLTLTAARDININAVMRATGTSSLTLNTATANGQDLAELGGTVRVGFNPDRTFKGRVDFTNRISTAALTTNTGFLTINGGAYTVINSLGVEGSTTTTDLQGMLSLGLYALGSDIDASATAGFEMGAGFAPVFLGCDGACGAFNGLGHTISNLTINRPTTSNVGLFSIVGLFSNGEGAAVSNVGLVNASVIGLDSVGALVGFNNFGSIYNSYATGVVSGIQAVGGLVGLNGGLIDNSYAGTRVTGTREMFGGAASNIGGLVGRNDFLGDINNSYATGAVSAELGAFNIGGLVGSIDSPFGGGNISNSYATGNVSAGDGSFNIGGFAGQNAGNISDSYAAGAVSVMGRGIEISGFVGRNFGTISRSDAAGAVSSGMDSVNVSGFVGLNDGVIDSSFATGAVSSEDRSTNTSGFVGGNRGAIRNSFASGVVTGGSSTGVIGGLVGFNSLGDIRDSYFTGSVITGSSVGLVGGLVGLNEGNGAGGSIFNSYSTGSVSTLGTVDRVGGLVGENRGGSISNSYATGAVSTGDGAFNVGGFVGRNVSGDFNSGSIDSSYATGAVSGGMGAYNLGGFAGSNDNAGYGGSISDSFATGSVIGGALAEGLGGFVGFNRGNISTSYSIGYVAAGGESVNLGGFAGINLASISSGYWNTETSGQAASAGGTGRTTAQMLQSSSFVGFDFARTWAQVDGRSLPYQRALFPNGIQVFSGTISSYTPGVQRVERFSGGMSFGQDSVGANGFYYTFASPNQTIRAGQQYQIDLVNGAQRGMYFGDAGMLNTGLSFNVGELVNASTLSFANRNIDLNVRNLGTINVENGVSFSRLFTNEGVLNVNANTAIDRLDFMSGTIGGSGNLTNGGEFFWLGGNIVGLGSLTTTGLTTLAGESTKDLSSTTWINRGTVDIFGGNLFLCDANIINQVGGTMNFLASNFRIEAENGTERFINAGTLNFDPFESNAATVFNNAKTGLILVAGVNSIDARFDNRGSVNVNFGFLDIRNGSSDDGGSDTGAYNIATGASLDFSGGTREWNTGVSFSRSGNLQINGVVNNNGAVNLSRNIGGQGTINNTEQGMITVNGVDRTDTFNPRLNNFGTLDISGSDSYTLALMNSPRNNGIVNIAASNTLRLNTNYTNNGILMGKGKIDVGDSFGLDESLEPNTLINNGTIRPGASPGTLEIVGNLDLMPGSVLDIELGGTAAGAFDVLNVIGNANLAGTLNTIPFDGFMPNNGDNFGFFSASTLSGAFSTVNSPAAFLSSLTYGPNAITLTALLNGIEPTLPPVRPPAPPIDPSLLTTLDFSDLPNTGTGGSAAANFNALLLFAPSALIGDGSGFGSELYLDEPLIGDLRDGRLLCR